MRYLLVSCQPHQCGVLFFIAVELDDTAVVAHFGKGEADVSLLFLRNGASLLLCLVVDFGAKARHYFVSGTAQVSRPPVVVNARDTPRKTFLAVGPEEWAGLCSFYHGRVHHPIGFIPISCQHRVGCAGICRLSRNVCLRSVQSRCLIGYILLGALGELGRYVGSVPFGVKL